MSVRSFTDLVDAFVVCDGTGELGGVGLVSVGVMAAVGVGVGGCVPCHGGLHSSSWNVCEMEGVGRWPVHGLEFLDVCVLYGFSCNTAIDWWGVWSVA